MRLSAEVPRSIALNLTYSAGPPLETGIVEGLLEEEYAGDLSSGAYTCQTKIGLAGAWGVSKVVQRPAQSADRARIA